MIMGAHQTIGVDVQAKPLMGFGEGLKKGLVIGRMVKDSLPAPTPIHDMVIGILVVDSEWASHGTDSREFNILNQDLTL